MLTNLKPTMQNKLTLSLYTTSILEELIDIYNIDVYFANLSFYSKNSSLANRLELIPIKVN